MKTKKILFDLQRWQDGDFVSVETESGLTVYGLTYFDRKFGQKLFGLVEDCGIIKLSFWDDGTHTLSGVRGSRYDLYLIVEDKKSVQSKKTQAHNRLIGSIEYTVVKYKKETWAVVRNLTDGFCFGFSVNEPSETAQGESEIEVVMKLRDLVEKR